MDASVVIGQTDFSTNTSGTTASTLSVPRGVKVCNGKLVVADNGNSRVLIWNTIPSTNGKPADLVLGQQDFESGSANRGGTPDANTLRNPWGIACAGEKLMVADQNNHRVLIWNTFPTTNGQSADVVVGQPNMTTATSHNGNDLDKLEGPTAVATDGTKLIVIDTLNQRFLIWNSIPTVNGTAADIVIGGNHGEGCTQDRISGQSLGVHIGHGKLFIAATFPVGAYRVLIWNSIPTVNHQPADVVIGQPDFTTCVPNTGTADGLQNVFDVATDAKGRMFIVDRGSQRVLLYNSIPTTNGVAADRVLGQASFSDVAVNQGQASPVANGFSGARGVAVTTGKVIVSDGDNNRLLVFYDSGPAPAAISPSPGATFTDASPTIAFSTDTNATCRISLIDESYDDMSTACGGAGTTAHTCEVPDLGANGTKNIYVACTDEFGDAHIPETNIELAYVLAIPGATPAPTPILTPTPTSTPIPSAPHTITLTKIGNLSTVNGVYTYYYITGKNLTFSGTTSPNAYVTLMIQSDPVICTTQADDQGNWTCTFEEEIPDGYHTLTVSAWYEGSGTISTDQYTLGIGAGLAETGSPAIVSLFAGAVLVSGIAVAKRRKH